MLSVLSVILDYHVGIYHQFRLLNTGLIEWAMSEYVRHVDYDNETLIWKFCFVSYHKYKGFDSGKR